MGAFLYQHQFHHQYMRKRKQCQEVDWHKSRASRVTDMNIIIQIAYSKIYFLQELEYEFDMQVRVLDVSHDYRSFLSTERKQTK